MENSGFFILWWHWIVLGIILVILEIFIPLFIIIWFGIAGIIVGIVDYIFNTSLSIELLLWIVLSVVFNIGWFKFYTQKNLYSKNAIDDKFNVYGTVIKKISKGEIGKVKFDKPVLGDIIWHAISDEEINVNERVKIVDIKGELMVVERIKEDFNEPN